MSVERPLLMSLPMAREVVAGNKTETRRVVKPDIAHILSVGTPDERNLILEDCPYGHRGDTFWVRESWRLVDLVEITGGVRVVVEYRAGPRMPRIQYILEEAKAVDQARRAWAKQGPWKPGIHMPKWACRIHLKITEISAERVRFINENGVRREGLKQCTKDGMLYKWGWEGLPWQDWYRGGAVEAFAGLWDSLNAERGYEWATNPWVWVICFKRI